jgi:hypothetical protein
MYNTEYLYLLRRIGSVPYNQRSGTNNKPRRLSQIDYLCLQYNQQHIIVVHSDKQVDPFYAGKTIARKVSKPIVLTFVKVMLR